MADVPLFEFGKGLVIVEMFKDVNGDHIVFLSPSDEPLSIGVPIEGEFKPPYLEQGVALQFPTREQALIVYESLLKSANMYKEKI